MVGDSAEMNLFNAQITEMSGLSDTMSVGTLAFVARLISDRMDRIFRMGWAVFGTILSIPFILSEIKRATNASVPTVMVSLSPDISVIWALNKFICAESPTIPFHPCALVVKKSVVCSFGCGLRRAGFQLLGSELMVAPHAGPQLECNAARAQCPHLAHPNSNHGLDPRPYFKSMSFTVRPAGIIGSTCSV